MASSRSQQVQSYYQKLLRDMDQIMQDWRATLARLERQKQQIVQKLKTTEDSEQLTKLRRTLTS